MTETIAGKMQNKTLNVVIVLDRSGSMDVVRERTIDAFNDFIGKQRKEPGAETTFFSLYIFWDKVERLWSAVPVDRVTNLTPSTYHPNGNTALLDAIAMAIKETEQQGNVLIVCLTDGMENASRNYSFTAIRDLIRLKTDCNWEFLWLGSDEQSREFALELGIPSENIELFKVTDEGIQDSIDKISDSVSLKKQSGSTAGWKDGSTTPTAPVKKQIPGKTHKKRQ
jgi:hypothetical protein